MRGSLLVSINNNIKMTRSNPIKHLEEGVCWACLDRKDNWGCTYCGKKGSITHCVECGEQKVRTRDRGMVCINKKHSKKI